MNTENDQLLTATGVRETSFGWMLKLVCTGLDKEMAQALKKHDLNIGQFAILMTLLEEDGLSQSDIGQKILMPGYATTRNIDKLEKDGLLKRHTDKNSRRKFCILLSAKGNEIAPKLFQIVSVINNKIFSPLDDTEIQQFDALLRKIIQTNQGS